MNLKTNIANKGNYGSRRSLNSIKYIVVHYTANDGDTDENNGIYFKNNDVDSSAHYFVDDDSVTQSVPDNYNAWHCGASKYKHAYCRNSNSIGVEICDDVRNGVIYPSAKTIANTIELVEYLMDKYSIPKENVIRHYDVTGKLCPAYWCDSTAKNKKWLTEFWNKLNVADSATTKPAESATATTKPVAKKTAYARSFSPDYKHTYRVKANGGLNMRTGAGTENDIIKTLTNGSKFICYGYYTRAKNGTIWLLGVDSSGVVGFCCKNYLI